MLSNELIKKIKRIEIRTRRLVADSFGGEYQSVFKGRGMEFDEVRPYQAGDEIRMIDWNVTARTGEPYIKRFTEERELTVLLVVDASGSGEFGSVGQFKRELSAELTAVLAFSATTNNDKVGLLIFTDQVELYIPPRKGRRHVLRIIRDLLTFEPKGHRTDLKLALDTANRVLKRRGIIFLISDFLDELPNYERSLAITNRRNDLVAVDLNDPMERSINDVGIIAMQDSETREIIWVDTSSRRWKERFAQRTREFETLREKAFNRAKVDRIEVTTQGDYVTALTKFFQRRTARLAR
ncbi:MAG TPA: DUF58 domain-containing protein [Anaerolineae bacterium]|nr:DUF58 domain-containing protein [Anaerolineae bacterium]